MWRRKCCLIYSVNSSLNHALGVFYKRPFFLPLFLSVCMTVRLSVTTTTKLVPYSCTVLSPCRGRQTRAVTSMSRQHHQRQRRRQRDERPRSDRNVRMQACVLVAANGTSDTDGTQPTRHNAHPMPVQCPPQCPPQCPLVFCGDFVNPITKRHNAHSVPAQ